MTKANNVLQMVIDGTPLPLKRHRDTTVIDKKSGQVRRLKYDPSSEDKKNFLWKCLSQAKPNKIYDEPLSVTMIFVMPRPKNHYRTGKNAGVLKNGMPIYHTKKPDLDNLIKFVKDALNGKYWKDDSTISRVVSMKIYGDKPKTTIIINSLN